MSSAFHSPSEAAQPSSLCKHYLVLINLKHDGLQYEGGRGNHVQRLLCLGQPVDEVLQGVVEIRGQCQGLF